MKKLTSQDASNQPKFCEAVPRKTNHYSKRSKEKHTLFDRVLDLNTNHKSMVVIFSKLLKLMLTVKSVDEILWCHSKEIFLAELLSLGFNLGILFFKYI